MLWNKKDKNGESIEVFITFNYSHRSAVFKMIFVEAGSHRFSPCFCGSLSCQSMRRKEDDGDRKRREEQVRGPGLMVHITPHYTTPRQKIIREGASKDTELPCFSNSWCMPHSLSWMWTMSF